MLMTITLLRIANLAVAIQAAQFDGQVAMYFDTTIKKCASYANGAVPCYCTATEDDFNQIFGGKGSISCNNPFTRNPAYLIANAVFTIVCAVLLLCLLLHFLGSITWTFCITLRNTTNNAPSLPLQTSDQQLPPEANELSPKV